MNHHCCSVTKSCPTLSKPMNCSMPCFPVLHLSPGICSNSCPLNQWCHPTISLSVTPFSSCPLSFPSLESFPVSHLFITGGQYMGASASDFLWDWLVWSFCCLRDSQESSPAPQFIMHIHNSSYILPILLLIMYDFSFFKFTFSHFQPIFLLYNLCNCKMLT